MPQNPKKVPLTGLLANLMERLQKAPIWARFASNSFWATVATGAYRGSSILATVFIARISGKVVVGELGILMSTVGMVSVLSGFGLSLTATKYVAQFRDSNTAKAGRLTAFILRTGLMTSILAAIALFVFARPLAIYCMNAPHLDQLIQICAVMLIFFSIHSIQTGILIGMESFRPLSRINGILGLSYVILTVAGVAIYGVKGALTGMTINLIAGCVLQARLIGSETAKRNIRLDFKNCTSEAGVLWRFGLPNFLSQASIIPVVWLCNLMLVNQAGGYAEMGAFAVGIQWFSVMIVVPSLLGQSIFPILNERAGARDTASLLKAWRVSVLIVSLISGLVCLGGAVCAQWILGMYGEGFVKYLATLRLMLIAGAMQAILDSIVHIVVTRSWMWTVCVMNAGFAATCLVASWFLAPWGASGLALARVSAYILHAIWIAIAAYVAVTKPWPQPDCEIRQQSL